jgi:phytoene dehydrogenase-like protein
MENADVVIIGAGISGIIAAIELEKGGLKPLILESTDRPGGRVKTDLIDGFQLDHGFQVLLTAYPEARHYLDYAPLGLSNFSPGAMVYSEGNSFRLSDPTRQPSKSFSMLFSSVGKFSDKLRILKLVQSVKSKTPEDIFSQPGTRTFDYLTQKGFSSKIIENFFQPFFAGIFLESDLSTSSNMFEFIFKMFSEGYAGLPEKGMQAIPEQLLSQLISSEIRYHSKVEKLTPRSVVVSEGEIQTKDIIIATNPIGLLPGLDNQSQKYHDVLNVYFETSDLLFQEPIIGLGHSSIINNFCYMTNVHGSYAPKGSHLLSVSLVDVPDSPFGKTLNQITGAWQSLTGQPPESLRFIKEYYIKSALPVLDHPAVTMDPKATKVQDHIFLAGDYLLNGSLNAAMTSGRLAAHALMAGRR